MKTPLVRLSCFIIFQLLVLTVYCQPFYTLHPTYNFQNFQVDQEDIHSNFIYDLYQDEKGFLWICTLNGLFRYDGYSFKAYYANPNSPASISGDTPVKILGDPAGGFWVSTRSSGLILSGEGLDYFDPISNSFTNYRFNQHQANAKENIIHDLMWQDGQSYFWAGTANGLVQFFPKTKKQVSYTNEASTQVNSIKCIAKKDNNQLWIGTNQGVFIFKDSIFTPVIEELQSFTISHLLVSSPNEILIGTTQGLFKYQLSEKRLSTITFNNVTNDLVDSKLISRYANNIKTIQKDKDESIWVGSQMGLFLLREDDTADSYNQEIRQNGNFLVNRVNTILQDQKGILWIGKSNGLSKGYPLKNKIEKYEVENPNIRAIAEKNNPRFFHLDGSVRKASCAVKTIYSDTTTYDWVGTSMGLYQFDPYKKIFYRDHPLYDYIPDLKDRNVTSFLKDSKGHYWVGYNNFTTHAPEQIKRRLVYFNSKTKEVRVFSADANKNKIPNGAIKSLVEDKAGNIWIACPRGLAKYLYEKEEVVFYNHETNNPSAISSNNIRLVFKDQLDQIWVGTNDNGLNLYREQTDDFISFTSQHNEVSSLSNNRINTLYHASDGWIWIGTESGLNRIHPKTNQIVRIPFNKSSKKIKTIVERENGILWIGVNENLYIYNISTRHINQLVIEDGIGEDLFINNSVCKNKNDALLLGCSSGLYFIPKEKSFTDNYVPPIAYTNLLIQRKEIIDTVVLNNFIQHNKLILPADKNMLEIQFAALDFIDPERKQYRYKLKGYLDDWQYIGSNNKIEFLNLPYDDYQLQVESSNKDGLFQAKAATLAITITPPWYLSWWAKVIYGLLLLGFIYCFYNLQLNRQLRAAATKRLFELNELKNKLYADITHEFRSPLTVIQGMVQQIKDKRYVEETNLIYQNSQHLLSLINKILDLSKLESGQMTFNAQQNDIIPFLKYNVSFFQQLARNKSLSVDVNISIFELVMDYDEEAIQTIFNNLLSNAIKYTQRGKRIITDIDKITHQKKEHLRIAIQDSGLGISSKDLPHIFDRYYQSNSTQTTHKGTGIGLALTRELVQLCNGQITASSNLGHGSTFVVLLPISNRKPILESSTTPLYPKLPISNNPTEAVDYTKIGNQPLILIIEDNVDVAKYLTFILKEQYQLIHALNGREGLEKAQVAIPDIIISDVMMPEMDGYTVITQLKKAIPTSHIPIILLSAKVMLEDKILGLTAGADAYIYKPFHSQELLVQIKQLLDQRKTLQRFYTQQIISPATVAPVIEDEFLIKVNQLILDNLSSEGMSDLLISQLPISRSQLYRKIKALTDLSTNNYIKKIRLKEAYTLVVNSSTSISNIAYDVGFNDPAYFSRAFKEVYGKSPRDFRQTMPSN